MIDTFPNAQPSEEASTGAVLSHDELENLIRSANNKLAFGGGASANAYERIVTLPRGGSARCEWRLGMDYIGQVRSFVLSLRTDETPPTELATFLFGRQREGADAAGVPFWELRHREVQSTERRSGIGTFMLQAGEHMIKQLHVRASESPTEIRLSAVGQPEVIEFAERNGYTRMDTPDGRLYEAFLAEPKSSEAPSSFILARLFREKRDLGTVLFSKDKLREAYKGISPLPENRFYEYDAEGVPIVRLREDEELIYERGVVLVSLRKDVGTITESAAQT